MEFLPVPTNMTPLFQLPVTFPVDNGLRQKTARERIVKKSCLPFIALFVGFERGSGPKSYRGGRHLPLSHLFQVVQLSTARAHPGVEINYQSIGSGGGIKQVSSGTVDFGASDMPMTDELLASCNVKLIHIPTVLGAVVPVFNVPGVSELRFSPDVLADIFLAKITIWNDPRIAKDNPGVHLPDQKIIVVHRSDGSGTTFIWTDYLSKVSTEWANGPARARRSTGPPAWAAKATRAWPVMCASCPAPSAMSS